MFHHTFPGVEEVSVFTPQRKGEGKALVYSLYETPGERFLDENVQEEREERVASTSS